MANSKDPEVFDQAYELYMSGEVQQAYDLLTEAAPRYPESAQRLFEWRLDMAARLGKLELSEQILKEALDAGCFYGEYALRKDDDMQGLQGRPVFEELAARSAQILADAQKESRAGHEILNEGRRDGNISSLLMALHGNNSNLEHFRGHWQSLAGSDWLVALPQSSQVSGKGVFVWNDMNRAELEVKLHYLELKKTHQIEDYKNILAGFSKGAHAAIQGTLQSWIPAAGFIAVAPYVGELKPWLPLIEHRKMTRVRGYFLLGEKDDMCTPGALKLMEKMLKGGIPCAARVVPGLGHEFPVDFEKLLPEALDFVLTGW